MAKQLVRKVIANNKSVQPEDLTVDFGFFTAGMFLVVVSFTFHPIFKT